MSKSIGFIGGGAMATGIIKGILSANTLTAEEIYVKELLPERQVYLKETYGLTGSPPPGCRESSKRAFRSHHTGSRAGIHLCRNKDRETVRMDR